MFGVSFTEMIVIAAVALLVFGPEQLPDLLRNLGKTLGMLRKSSDQVRKEVYQALYPPIEDLKRSLEEERREIRALKAELSNPVAAELRIGQHAGLTPMPDENPAPPSIAPPDSTPPPPTIEEKKE